MRDNCVDDLAPPVAGVGDEDTRGPIDPAVPRFVEDLESVGMVPDYRGLPEHRHRLVFAQPFQSGNRTRRRQVGDDSTQSYFKPWDPAGRDSDIASHRTV